MRRPSVRIRLAHAALWTLALPAAAAPVAKAAPATPTYLPIQGVARDAEGGLIPSGDVAVRIYSDSLGGTPLYDSGSEFAGAITQGIFDVLAGGASALLLDQEQRYFLELDVAGIEILGDAAAGRWPFYPGGGSHARPDLEARLTALESAVGPAPATRAADTFARGAAMPARTGGMTTADIHGLLGFSRVDGAGAAHGATGNLLVQPVGARAGGGITVELGPYYLFAPGADPVIRFVRDVPGDQGRAVRIRWRRDLRERPHAPADPTPRITGYTLYRRVDPGQAAPSRGLRAAAEGPLLEPHDRTAEPFALPPGEWDVLTSVPATLDSAYQTVVPTLCDSTSSGVCWSVFVVRAITDQIGAFHDSRADSGWSVDNLAPGVPQGLVVQAVSGGTGLSWQPSAAPDFQYFRIYRDGNPDFTPGPATLVHATASTGWTDPVTGSFTWKVTAVDFNGNESEPAVGTTTVSVESDAPAEIAFAAISPNPFRGTLSLVLEVPEHAGKVELGVFDVAGRRVRTLVRSALSAGRHAFHWDGTGEDGGRAAAGIYVMRLSGAGRSLTRRATLLP